MIYPSDCLDIKKALLHRIFYPEFTEVDHIDRNGLNNLRFNIREGAGKVNANNKGIQINNKSGVTGVIFEDGLKSRWKAQWNLASNYRISIKVI